MAKLTVRDLDAKGKEVLMRVDFNVPLKDGEITNDARIVAALPTIKFLLDQGARLVLTSHLGRPKNEPDPAFSLKPVAARLSELLGKDVKFVPAAIGPEAEAARAAMKDGDVVLLENVRFYPGEKKNDPEFAKSLLGNATLFVNDAFGTAHRAHASTEGVTHFAEKSAMGFLIERELEYLEGKLENPEKPFVVIMGGAKVSDKIGVINNLLEKADTIIIGGGMAYTFARAQGGSIGKSLCEPDKLDYALEMLRKAKDRGVQLLLPTDTVAAAEFSADADSLVVPTDAIPDDMEGLDIGPETIRTFCAAVRGAGTVVWNGPMGVFEFEKFAAGTRAMAQALADSGAVTIVGGGDSAAAVEQMGFADRITHISTGGGASLEFLEGIELPGVACLLDK